MMKKMSAREKSILLLGSKLKPEGRVIRIGFKYIENLIKIFEDCGYKERDSEDGVFSRVCGITLVKANYYLLGCYNLILEGFGQESGALLRPIIELYELLVYFRQEKRRITKVLEDKLPSAGNIGGLISGDFQDLRNYFNENSSHFKFKIYSLNHLLNEDGCFQALPNQSIISLRKNLKVLNAFQVFLVSESLNCFTKISSSSDGLYEKIQKWRTYSIKIFPS